MAATTQPPTRAQARPPVRLRDGWEADTPSADTLVLAGFRAMMVRTRRWALAAGGRVEQRPEVVLADSGSPCLFLNEVISTAPLTVELAELAGAFFPTGRPFVMCSPRGGADLRGAGLTLVGHPPLMLRPAGGTSPEPPEGVTVEEVTDPDGLVRWAEVVTRGFPLPAVTVPAALLGGPHRFWLASWHGEPAAAAASSVSDGVVDVEAVATLPTCRGRGLGAAVTWAATLADPALPAVLLSSDPGRPVYQRMGFLPVLRATMWARA
jgi:GNAT superfamily N-acetyltransferase